MRLDPGSDVGSFDIDWIELIHEELHPLTIDRAETLANAVRFYVTNHRDAPLEFTALRRQLVIKNVKISGINVSFDGKLFDRPRTLAGRATDAVDVPLKKQAPLEGLGLYLKSTDLPDVSRIVFVHHADIETDWLVRQGDGFLIQIAKDGSLARIRRGDECVAILGPLVHTGGDVPALRLVAEEPAIRFKGEGVELELSLSGPEIRIAIQGSRRCTGPVVRVFGGLEQGLLAGLEYLGKGERSSTTLDVETAEHLRFAPDPLKVTMPLMAFVTDKSSVAMHWTDMTNQPLYATPNFFDCTPDHYMALEGNKIEATIRVDQGRLEEAILWAVRKQGLPPLPKPPRTREEQITLCLQALNGPLKTADGWGHCVEPNWERHPFAPMASTIWRLTGEILPLPETRRGRFARGQRLDLFRHGTGGSMARAEASRGAELHPRPAARRLLPLRWHLPPRALREHRQRRLCAARCRVARLRLDDGG